MHENQNKLLTMRELAELLSIHPGSVRRWVSLGQVPYRKIGKAVRFTQADIDAIIGQPVHAGDAV